MPKKIVNVLLEFRMLKVNTLYNVCSVHRGDTMSTSGVFSTSGHIMSTLGDVQYIGGYHEYIGGIS